MWDKHGRYVHIKEVKTMRVFYVDGQSVVFIAHREIPVYLILEALEKTYAP